MSIPVKLYYVKEDEFVSAGEGKTIDISAHGARIQTGTYFKEGMKLKVEMKGTTINVVSIATVVHVMSLRDHSFQIGVAFEHPI